MNNEDEYIHLPKPTFISVDDGGALNIEWCFGQQGAPDSWRAMFVWDPAEGVMACKTTKVGQLSDVTENAAHVLAAWLVSDEA